MCSGSLEMSLQSMLALPFCQIRLNQVLTWEQFDVQLIQHDIKPLQINFWWEATAQKTKGGVSTTWSSTYYGTYRRKGTVAFSRIISTSLSELLQELKRTLT